MELEQLCPQPETSLGCHWRKSDCGSCGKLELFLSWAQELAAFHSGSSLTPGESTRQADLTLRGSGVYGVSHRGWHGGLGSRERPGRVSSDPQHGCLRLMPSVHGRDPQSRPGPCVGGGLPLYHSLQMPATQTPSLWFSEAEIVLQINRRWRSTQGVLPPYLERTMAIFTAWESPESEAA